MGILQPKVPKSLEDMPIAQAAVHDLEKLCPISSIREYTKTDDIPYVTDDQLALYRRAAFESTEHYAGILTIGTRRVIEPIKVPMRAGRSLRPFVKHRLSLRPSQDIAYMYGPGLSEVTHIEIGKRMLRLPNLFYGADWSQCCAPCGSNDSLFMIAYTAGYASCDEVPAGIILGVLKYIAWAISNPGDELKTVNNSAQNSRFGLSGTNNIAWASGALELWRQYNEDAI